MERPTRVTDMERARAAVAVANRLIILTGAGVSAESGIPTFRGAGGLWKDFRPEELATPEAFSREPALVWEWYEWRRGLVRGCEPNPAHMAIADHALRQETTQIVTQNVDGLHHRAARRAARLRADPVEPDQAYPIEVHGALHRNRCSSCDEIDAKPAEVDASSLDTLPRCPSCSALMRPDVVWFGEPLNPQVLETAHRAAHDADVCLVVGTSSLVYPAAAIPEVTAAHGGRVIEVNLDPTPLTAAADISLRGRAGSLVPELLRA